MKKLRKLLGIAMVLALVFNTISIGTSAVLGDGNQLSADVNLQVGTYVPETKAFTELSAGEALATDQVIAVRICPQTDFYVGNSRYVVMFDKNYFELVQNGSANDAFIPNSDQTNITYNDVTEKFELEAGYSGNHYYDFVCSGYAAQTTDITWPATFVANESTTYSAVAVTGLADSNSYSGGKPEIMSDGSWLFQFELKALQPVTTSSNARIWMDSRWFRSSADNSLPAYFQKGTQDVLISTPGQGYTNLAFNFDFAGADIKLALPSGAVTSTITFDTAGGSAIADLVGNVGDTVTPIPANPTRKNYRFKGWDKDIPANYPAGGATITAQWVMIGDVNQSGSVTSADATAILKYKVGLITLTGDALIAADTNKSGSITSLDATTISKWKVGIYSDWPNG